MSATSLRPAVLFVAALALAPATAISAQADPDRAVAGGGTLPAGWNARTDRNQPMTNVKFAAMADGFHFTLGPAAIFWRATDSVSVGFHGVATMTQTKAPTHPEAYGLFLGGKNLGDSTLSYTYFLVRTKADTGQFSIWRRSGSGRPTAIVGWTTNAAVNGADAQGMATNELSFLVQGGTVKFMVNGKDVHTANASDVDTQGIVGYRINHNLDVHVSSLGVHRM